MEKIIKFVKKNKSLLLVFFCLIAFIAILEDVVTKDIMKGDIIGYKIISKTLISDFMTPIAKIITNFGGTIIITIIIVILFIFIKNKKICLSIFLNVVFITVLNQLLKFIVQRPRPITYRIIDEKGYSFPSGHSMVSMAFYGYLIYLIYKHIKNKFLKYSLIIILSVLIVMIGISRIYLGVHYTSDVIAGFLVSIVYLVIYIKFSKKFIV